MSHIVYNSTDASILAQFITGVVGIKGLYEKLEPEHEILRSVLGWEMIVQGIEILFYIFLIRKMTIGNMAATRYFDWVITTPTMLITSILYYKYEENLEKFQNTKGDKDKEVLRNMSFVKFIKDNKENIIKIVFCNFFMLLFGYLGEIGIIDIKQSFVLGTVFFLMAFYIIYDNYAKYSKKGKQMFNILLGVWSIYGIAFLLNPIYKNTMFNGLDIVAKNFFGVYLYFKIKESQNIKI